MPADRKSVKEVLFQCDDGRTGNRGVLIRCNEYTINLNTDKLGEITVCNEFQRAVSLSCVHVPFAPSVIL